MDNSVNTTENVRQSTDSEKMETGPPTNSGEKMTGRSSSSYVMKTGRSTNSDVMKTGHSTNSDRLNMDGSNEVPHQTRSDVYLTEDRMSTNTLTRSGGSRLTPRETDDIEVRCTRYLYHYHSPKRLNREKQNNTGRFSKSSRTKARKKIINEWDEEPIDEPLFIKGRQYSLIKKHQQENEVAQKMISMPCINFQKLLDKLEASEHDNEILQKQLQDIECELDQMREDKETAENGFDYTISRLNEQHNRQEDEILRLRELEKENERKEGTITSLQHELTEKIQIITRMEQNEIERITTTSSEIEQDKRKSTYIKEVQQENQSLLDCNYELNEENKKLENDISNIHNRLDNDQQQSLETVKQRLFQMEKEVPDYEKKMEELKAANDDKDNQLKDLQARLHKLEQKLVLQKTDYEMKIQTLNDAKLDMSEKCNDEIYELQQDKLKLETDVYNLSKQIDKLNEEMKNGLTDHQPHWQSTENEIGQYKIQLQKLSEEYQTKDDEVVALRDKLADVEQTFEQCTLKAGEQIKSMENEISRYQQTINELEQREQVLQEENRNLNKDLSTQKQLFENKSTGMLSGLRNYQNLLQELDETRASKVNWKNECDTLRNALADMETKLLQTEHDAKANMRTLRNEKMDMDTKFNKELSRLLQDKNELEQHVGKLSRDNDELERHIDQQRQTFEKKSKESARQLENIKQNDKERKDELDETKARLRKCSEEFENKNHEIATLRSKLMDAGKTLQQTHGKANKKIDGLEKEKSSLTSEYHMEISRLEQSRSDLEKRVKNLSSENDELKREVYERRDTEKALMDSHAKYSSAEESFRNQIALLQHELETTQEELRQTTHESKEMIQNMESEKIDSNTEFSQKLSRLRHDKSDLERQIKQFAHDNDKLKSAMAEERLINDKKLTESTQTVHKYKYELNDANRRLKELYEEEEMRNKEIAALRSRLVDVEKTSQQAGRNANERIEALEMEKSSLTTEYKKDVLRHQQKGSDLQRLVESLTSENDKLQKELNKCKDSQKELRDAKTRFSADEHSFRNKIVVLQQELETAQNDLQQAKHEARERIEIMKSENIDNNAELSQKISKLKHDKNDLERRIEKLTKDNDKLKKDLTEQRLTFDKVSTESSSQLEQTTKSLQRYKDDLKDCKRRLRECCEEEEMRNKEIAALRSRLADVEKTSQQAGRNTNERIKALEMENSNLTAMYNKDVSKLQQNENDLQRLIESLTSENAKLQKELSERKDSEKKLMDTKTKLQKFSDEEVVKDNEIAKLRTRLAKLENELQQKNREANKYKQEISGIQQTKQDKEKHADTLYKERDRLQQMLNERENKGKELRDIITKQKQQMDNFQAEHKTEIAKLLQQRHDLESHISNIEQENKRVKADSQRLTKKLERGQKERHSSDDYKALQNRLQRVEMELKEARLNAISKEKRNVELDNKALNSKLNKIHVKQGGDKVNQMKKAKADMDCNTKSEATNAKRNKHAPKQNQETVIQLVNKFEQQGLGASSEDRFKAQETRTNNCSKKGIENTQKTDLSPKEVELSDIYRPTNLARRFNELFDQQWDEAFEVLQDDTGQEKRQIIHILLTILTRIKEFCNRESKQHLEDIQKVITQSEKVRQRGVPDQVMGYIKDCRKASFDETVQEMFEKYQTELTNASAEYLELETMVEDYTKECLKICWLIAIQNQQIVFAPEPTSGSPFSSDVYNTYTESGTTVDYLVWPALLLDDDDGPVLSKGVVEPDEYPEGDQVGGRKRKQ